MSDISVGLVVCKLCCLYRADKLISVSWLLGTILDHGNYLTSENEFFLDVENSAGLLFASSELQVRVWGSVLRHN